MEPCSADDRTRPTPDDTDEWEARSTASSWEEESGDDADDMSMKDDEDGGVDVDTFTPLSVPECAPLMTVGTTPDGTPCFLQQPCTAFTRASDPLILALDASTSMRKLNLNVLGEALTRLFTFLESTQRRVSIFVFHSEVIVMHPAQGHMFPFVRCKLHSAAPLRVEEEMLATFEELHTVFHQPIAQGNIEYLVKSYLNIIRGLGSETGVHHTWLTSTLRVAASVLRGMTTRTDHAQVLLVCDGGEFYGKDARGKQAYLEAPAIVSRLVPALAPLPCTVGVSCLALGPDAELDTLGALACAFDGVLAYAPTAADVGVALVEVFRFLARRPAQLVATAAARDMTAALMWPDDTLAVARHTFARARAAHVFGTDVDTGAWIAASPSGGAFALPTPRDSLSFFTNVGEARLDALPTYDTTPMEWHAARLGQRALAALLPLVSWRTKRVAAADTDAQTRILADVVSEAAALGVPSYLFAPLAAAVDARTAAALHAHAEDAVKSVPTAAAALKVSATRTAFVRMLQVATHPMLRRMNVMPAHQEALDALPVDSGVVAARTEFEAAFPSWVSANAARQARYTCSVMGDAQEPLCAPARVVGAASCTLWAPTRATGVKGAVLTLAPSLDLTPQLMGVNTHDALTRGAWCATDIVPTDTGFTLLGAHVPRASRQGRELAAVVAAPPPPSPHAVPLILRIDDAANTYVSMRALQQMSRLVYGSEHVWHDTTLPMRVYGSVLVRCLDAVCDGAPCPITDVALLTDVVRSLTIMSDANLVTDVYARYVTGRATTDETLALERVAGLREAEETAADTGVEVVVDAPTARTLLNNLASGTAFRTPEVAGNLPALLLFMALFRNVPEYMRAKQVAIKQYVDATVTTQKVEAALEFEAEVERRLASSLAARRLAGRAQPSKQKVRGYRHTIRRALAAERASSVTAEEGTELDAENQKTLLTQRVLRDMPPSIDVMAAVDVSKFKISDFSSRVLPLFITELAARGYTPSYLANMQTKAQQLHDLADGLMCATPAPRGISDAVANVFEVAKL